jgi:hypothetical protein
MSASWLFGNDKYGEVRAMDAIQRFLFAALIFVPPFIIAMSGPLTTFVDASQADRTVDLVTKSWIARQSQVRSARFCWTQHQFMAKNSIPKMPAPGAPNSRVEGFPPEDISHDVVHSLVFEESKMAYTYDGKVVSVDSRLVPYKFESAFDGKTYKTFSPFGTDTFPSGTAVLASKSNDARRSEVLPLFVAFRALDPAMGLLTQGHFKSTGKQSLIGGRSCVAIQEIPDPRKKGLFTFWVDAERDWNVVRITVSTDDQVETQTDISYKQDDKCGWIPSAWSYIWIRGQSLVESSESTVTGYSINPPLAANAFEIVFPPGALIYDETQGSELGNWRQYLVREDGSVRIVSPADVRNNVTYEQLIAETRSSRVNRMLLTVCIMTGLGIVLAAICRFLWRYKNRKTAT